MPNEIKPIPDSPQERFIKSSVRELGYGGQAGGGKSFALILDAVYQLPKKDYHAILFRRSYKQLREAGGLIDLSRQIYPSLGGVFNEATYTWKFPRYHDNTIRVSYLEREANIEEHAGSQYPYVAFDELENFSERQYLFLFSRNRSANPDINLYVRSTFNPGGIGHHWIKKRFIEPFRDSDGPKYFKRVNGVDTETSKDDPLAVSRFFISARLEDNPYLWNDGNSEYERNLYQLDAIDFQRLRMGDWDIRRTGRVYHAFPGPGPDVSALDLSKVSGYYHAHDFGAVNQVWGLFAKIEGRYYMIHEQKLPEGTTAARAAIIKSHFANRKIVAGYGGAKGEDQQRLDYGKEGVVIRLPVITDVEGQINLANRMFEKGELIICANCVYTIDMLENCVRDEKEGIQDKAQWHYADMCRYFAAGAGRGVFVG